MGEIGMRVRNVNEVSRNLWQFLVCLSLRCMSVFECANLQALIRVEGEVASLSRMNKVKYTSPVLELTKSSTWTVFLAPLKGRISMRVQGYLRKLTTGGNGSR